MSKQDENAFGPLLHGTARSWRVKLDERLKPMGLSQAKWRTLLHLSIADEPMTQAEIAARLGIEEPSLVTLLHRLENEGWVERRASPEDRRCKTVHLCPRAERVIVRINQTATALRRELLADIAPAELRACVRVLMQIQRRAEQKDASPIRRTVRNGQNGVGHRIHRTGRRRNRGRAEKNGKN
jgi:MarR family transcriptional regulator for hemolysin